MIRFSGRLRSSLIVGLQGIRARKLRTLLSILSLFLGVLAVVAVQAAAETFKRVALTDIELTEGKEGTLQVFLHNTQMVPMAAETVQGHKNAVLVGSMQATIGEPGVMALNPGGGPFDLPGGGGGPEFMPEGEVSVVCDSSGGCTKMFQPFGPGQQRPRGQAIDLQLNVISGDIRQFKPFRPVAGQWLDFASPPSLAPRLVVNKEAAKGLLRHRVPAELHVDGAKANMTPQIIGVIDDGRREPTAYVRMDELTNWMSVNDFNARGGVSLMLAPEAADLVQVLESKMRASGHEREHLFVQPVRMLEQISNEFKLIQWIFMGMASLVLLIGVAGILNVGLATVGERIEEFALRRAVGTPRMLLAGIVLAETMLTGLFTAAAAIGVAALAIEQIGPLLPFDSASDISFPWQAATAGVIAGLVAGLLGGMIPAIRAARIPIATVMRA